MSTPANEDNFTVNINKNENVLNSKNSKYKWLDDCKIIHMIYQRICKTYLSDDSHNNKYIDISKLPIKPLFRLKIVTGDEKVLKKKIQSIYKSFRFNKLESNKIVDILFKSRF